MPTGEPFVISLPIADRPRAMAFYRDAFALDAFGEPADDGVPEPLQIQVGPGTVLMLIPTGGFGWVLPGREIAAPGVSECLLSLPFSDDRALDDAADRVRAAGGTVIVEPEAQPWGYSAVVADPDGHAWQLIVPTSP